MKYQGQRKESNKKLRQQSGSKNFQKTNSVKATNINNNNLKPLDGFNYVSLEI